jgi:hypothetical protein
MRFYRGITVPSHTAQAVISVIKHGGLLIGAGQQWSISIFDLKPRLRELQNLETLSLPVTRSMWQKRLG